MRGNRWLVRPARLRIRKYGDPALAGWHYWSLVIENLVGGPQIIPLGVGLAVAALCVPCFGRAFSNTQVPAQFPIWAVVVIVGLAIAVFAFM